MQHGKKKNVGPVGWGKKLRIKTDRQFIKADYRCCITKQYVLKMGLQKYIMKAEFIVANSYTKRK
jgi:hypothetical protein